MGSLETPASTAWPLIMAVGVTGLLAGLVTSPAVSAASGVLFVVAAAGWLREVLPHEHHEPVPLAVPAPAALPAERLVKHLAAGERGHRTRLPVAIYPYRAGLAGGAAGGVAMAALALLHGMLAHGSVWYTVNLLAAAGSAELASAPPEVLARFSAEGFALALAIHTLLSLGVGLLYGALLPMFPWHPAWWGGVVAPLLWTALIAATLGVLNPALDERIAWPWFVASQVGFGVVAGLVVARFERVATFQHAALAERAGLESKGLEAGDE